MPARKHIRAIRSRRFQPAHLSAPAFIPLKTSICRVEGSLATDISRRMAKDLIKAGEVREARYCCASSGNRSKLNICVMRALLSPSDSPICTFVSSLSPFKRSCHSSTLQIGWRMADARLSPPVCQSPPKPLDLHVKWNGSATNGASRC